MIDKAGLTLEVRQMALNVKTRNVSLTSQNEAFITERVASGRFANASEVVRAGLRLLADEEQRPDKGADRAAHRKQDNPAINVAGS